jgi:DNA polymerase
MRDKPTNIHELLRRAISVQVDLGTYEVILSGSRPRGGPLNSGNETASEKIISAEEAIRPETHEHAVLQAGLDLYQASSFDSLDAHFEAIRDCRDCPLSETRNKLVYGVGSPDADLLFIGEAPGADEDREGEPFVGRAGKLLDKILAAIGFTRGDVYIANILKCRPPGNRDPQPDEMNRCFPHLREQVRLIRPKLICALGRVAGQALLKTTTPLGKLRGRWHEYEGVPLLVTYHPAALLRFPAYKRETWEDMQLLKAKYDELTGGK